MKRIFYCLAILGITFVGCNPMEDIYDGLDSAADPIEGTDFITLTSDDYAAIVEQGDDEEPDYYETFEAFSDVDDAKAMLPPFLSNRYPFWGEGSSVTVSYNLYDGNPEDVSALTNADVYNLGSSDYISSNSNAFLLEEDAESALEDVLATQFTTPTEGQVVRLGYNKFTAAPEVGLANVYEAAFPTNFGDFELNSVSGLDELGWNEDAAFVVGSGYNGSAVATEEWLISPEIDLTDQSGVLLQITQEIDFFGADSNSIDILVSTDYTTGGDVSAATWNVFTFDKTLFGGMTTSDDLDFSTYDGETIHISFKYTSTDSASARWRIQDFAVRTIGFSGDKESLSSYYKYTEGFWDNVNDVYYLNSADYDSMGTGSGQPGQYNNFSNSTSPSNYLPQFLNLKYPFAQEEDELFITYKYYGGSGIGTVIKGNLYTFINGSWSPIVSSLQFGFKNSIWVPDNTIRHTLVQADYDAIVSGLATDYPGPTSSMGNYGNMDRRVGNSNEWTDAMVLEAVAIVLDINDPSAPEGQKYVITIEVYNGSNTTEDFAVIKRAGGEWDYQTEDD